MSSRFVPLTPARNLNGSRPSKNTRYTYSTPSIPILASRWVHSPGQRESLTKWTETSFPRYIVSLCFAPTTTAAKRRLVSWVVRISMISAGIPSGVCPRRPRQISESRTGISRRYRRRRVTTPMPGHSVIRRAPRGRVPVPIPPLSWLCGRRSTVSRRNSRPLVGA